jgi:hypothetical protein
LAERPRDADRVNRGSDIVWDAIRGRHECRPYDGHLVASRTDARPGMNAAPRDVMAAADRVADRRAPRAVVISYIRCVALGVTTGGA